MAAIFDFKTVGLRDLDKKFRNLGKKVQTKVMKRIIRESAKELKTEIQNETPVENGDLRRGLKVRAVKGARRRGEIAIGVFTPDRAALGLSATGGYYPAAIQFGYKHSRNGKRIPANPFMTRGTKKAEPKVRAKFLSEARQQIEQEAKTA